MTFQEKSAWVMILALAVSGAFYALSIELTDRLLSASFVQSVSVRLRVPLVSRSENSSERSVLFDQVSFYPYGLDTKEWFFTMPTLLQSDR